MKTTESTERLQQWVDEARRIVFFGGAGVSTESGLKDFRGEDGLYRQTYTEPPETILSRAFFEARPADFFRFYRDKMLPGNAQPNAAHLKLAEWERAGKLLAVITQNIDGLHQKAGSRAVLELHGSVYRNRCARCGKRYDSARVAECEGIPRCACGGIVKPDVVLYGESLDEETVRRAVEAIRAADLLIVGGTSLTVYPAAGFLDEYRGNRLVLINRSPTAFDNRADLVIDAPIGQVLGALRG